MWTICQKWAYAACRHVNIINMHWIQSYSNPKSNKRLRKMVNLLDKRYVILSCSYFSKVELPTWDTEFRWKREGQIYVDESAEMAVEAVLCLRDHANKHFCTGGKSINQWIMATNNLSINFIMLIQGCGGTGPPAAIRQEVGYTLNSSICGRVRQIMMISVSDNFGHNHAALVLIPFIWCQSYFLTFSKYDGLIHDPHISKTNHHLLTHLRSTSLLDNKLTSLIWLWEFSHEISLFISFLRMESSTTAPGQL